MNKQEIVAQLHNIAEQQNLLFTGTYTKAKDLLEFTCKETGIKYYSRWDNIKSRGKIPLLKSQNRLQHRVKQLEKECNITALTEYKSYVNKIDYKCNSCGKQYSRRLCDINTCHCISKPYKNNGGINQTTTDRNPNMPYYIYFVYLPEYQAYKVGLYRIKWVKSRFNRTCEVIFKAKTTLSLAYKLEQEIISSFKDYKYTGEKFGGYTEAFNSDVPTEQILKILNDKRNYQENIDSKGV